MKISPEGIALIKQFEGCKLEAYQDSVGIWTVGYGHTHGVKEGLQITQEIADQFLDDDLEPAEKCIANSVKVSITQGQYDALCSFVYNLGCGTLRASSLLTKLNDGDEAGAAEVILKYNHAGGKIIAGLTTRRKAESELFLT